MFTRHCGEGHDEGVIMRKTLLALSTFAVAVIVASVGGRSEAAPLGNAGALAGARGEVAVVDSVHCRPGWRHHRPNDWRRVDGCRRGYSRTDVYVVPGRTRYIWRDGVRVRVGDGYRGGERRGDRVRSRTDVNVNIRGGEGRRGGGEVRGGGQRGGGEVRGGGQRGGAAVQGGGSPRQGAGGGDRGGQGAGGGQGGGAQPGGGVQQKP
jgi:hypothetical protein